MQVREFQVDAAQEMNIFAIRVGKNLWRWLFLEAQKIMKVNVGNNRVVAAQGHVQRISVCTWGSLAGTETH